ncbi:aldo/keto reductase [Microbacterium sp. ZW T5_45]|uniref:aldo/keto reductase n=1 Tax=Microbacterium sp. ZW T5_45 TaxID=3378080 RepID=UPI003853BBDE
MSALGLGCNNFGMKIDAEQTNAVVGAALEAGITHFDTAEMYGEGRSEEFLGAALGSRRDEVVIATKFLPRSTEEAYRPGALAERVVAGAEASLKRLGTDYIDVFYQHYPDADAPQDELFEAFEALTRDGKVRHVALSNTSSELISAAAAITEASPAHLCAVQVEWSLLNRDSETKVVPAAAAAGLGVVPYFPLASGLLTGKYRPGAEAPEGSRFAALPWFAQTATEERLAATERLRVYAQERGHELIELALGWLLTRPEVSSVIAGATTPDQVRANAASTAWRLTTEQLAEIDELLAG